MNLKSIKKAATNRPDLIDEALLRPDSATRYKIFQIHTRNMPLDQDVDLIKLSSLTLGYSGADIENLCREAAIFSLRESLENLHVVSKKHVILIHYLFQRMEHFLKAKSILTVQQDEKWNDDFYQAFSQKMSIK